MFIFKKSKIKRFILYLMNMQLEYGSECLLVEKKMFGNKCEIFDVSSIHYEKKLEVIYAKGVYTNSPDSDLENIH